MVYDALVALNLRIALLDLCPTNRRLYERAAIEKYFKGATRKTIRSPVTNVPISTRLTPSPLIKSHIEALIAAGTVTDDLKSSWEKRIQEQDEKRTVLQKARDGDVRSMYNAYFGYRSGQLGFEENGKLALEWLKKAHVANYPCGTASLGTALVLGKVGDHKIAVRKEEGVALIAIAAERGSDHAAFELGFAYSGGGGGCCNLDIRLDAKQAISWFQKGLDEDCPFKHTTDWFREKARAKLQELLASQK